MENKIDIAAILKDCPRGLELDCTIYEGVTLDSVVFESEYHYENTNTYPIKIVTKNGFSTRLTKYGQNVDIEEAKCVIFPKGKKTWEGFVPPYKFKNGDILFVDANDEGDDDDRYKYVFIFEEMLGCNKEEIYGRKVMAHCYMTVDGYFKPRNVYLIDSKYPIRFATVEEKQKLFQTIEENGYKWNTETKTLEKVKPKFEIGDKIVDTLRKHMGASGTQGVISKITDDKYFFTDGSYMSISSQDNWELVPNKFDVKTLKTFDEVLVRLSNNCIWMPKLFSYYDIDPDDPKMKYYPFVTLDNIGYPQCIPYNGNEHLSRTTNNCDEFYRVWEK